MLTREAKMDKNLRIRIGERRELDKDINRFLDDPSLVDKEPEDVLFLRPEEFSQIFTKNRVEVLKKIGDSNPRSMGDLVESLKRPKESISRDVGILTKSGLVEIETRGIYRCPKLVNRQLSVAF
jgi:predicted transcriptional regulator